MFGSRERARALRRGRGPHSGAGRDVRNLAGETTLREFIDLAAACRLFLTNDSGAMHVASALGVPTVAVFGATDDTTTGPTGPLARVVREHAECSPCLLRECPIDHRCMTRVTADRGGRRRSDPTASHGHTKQDPDLDAALRLPHGAVTWSPATSTVCAPAQCRDLDGRSPRPLLVVVLPLRRRTASAAARAEMAAALRMVDYVVIAE